MRAQILKSPVVAVGAAGFTIGLVALYTGMRDVMRTSGGFCANGGPYVIANQCSSRDVHLILVGIAGILVFGLILAIGTALLRGPMLGSSLAMWATLFGALGWNFIALGFTPPPGSSASGGWIASGVVFWLMAAAGLVPVLVMSVNWLRHVDEGGPL